MGFGAMPTSLGKFSEVEKLLGDIKLKEGANIILTRDDPNNALEIAAEAAPYNGFGNDWLFWESEVTGYTFWNFDFDEMRIWIGTYLLRRSIYSAPMRPWNLASPHECGFRAVRGPQGAGNPNAFMGIAYNNKDYWNNQTQNHIGFTHVSNFLHAVNGDGAARTDTNLSPLHLAGPRWLRWKRLAASIEFYVDGVLSATHNTNIPAADLSCFWVLSVQGVNDYVRSLHITNPAYRELF